MQALLIVLICLVTLAAVAGRYGADSRDGWTGRRATGPPATAASSRRPAMGATLTMSTLNRRRHDVVVVGARVAGSATALLLARLGHDVLVVDQASFSTDTTSTHSIARSGVVQLRRWGLLDEVLDSGAPPIRQVTFNADGASLSRPIQHKAGVDFLVAPAATCWTRSWRPPPSGPGPSCASASP
jgi:FAD binding domain